MYESGIDIDFDLFDLDDNIFEDSFLENLLNCDGKTPNFYELKSTNIINKHLT
jgi:hypothetical protein